MVQGVSELGLEVCYTLGMLTDDQAKRLEDAGLYAYNHNLDTSESYHPNVVSTRSYQDRLHTLANVLTTSITLCCGGILGLGESEDDRIALLHTLTSLDPHPESVPTRAIPRGYRMSIPSATRRCKRYVPPTRSDTQYSERAP
jgi:biotin synthase